MPDTPFPSGWDLAQSPFHDGEIAIQQRVGVRDKIDALGRRAVRRYLTDQQRAFFPLLPYVFVGTVDAEGRPWASVLFGRPGFVMTTDEATVRLSAKPLHGDPLADNLRVGGEIAILGVQLNTRRRNRLFGSISSVTEQGVTVSVRQTLGICPQYIQGREPEFTHDPLQPGTRPLYRADQIDARAKAIIEGADTYFVASVDPRQEDGINKGADISHRGGRTGFVRVNDDATLTAPDFVGNFIFNTLGNWQFDNRAGLLFIDFASGDVLYVAARAEVIWDGPELRAFAGAQRLVRYHVEGVIRVEGSLPARFTPPEYSPLVDSTGTWKDVDRTLDAERIRYEWRAFRVMRVADESPTIRSFYLEPTDGRGLASFRPGQFLPVRIKPEGWRGPAVRTYTISSVSGAPFYRISVRRTGRGGVSDWLHDAAGIGDTIEAMSPRGDFTFESEPDRSVVFISAGVGITPFVAMLDALLVNDGRTRHHAPIWLFHGATNSASHAFADHLDEKARRHPELRMHVRYSCPLPTDRAGLTHDGVGHIDLAVLKATLPFDDHEFYLCGPAEMMQSLYDGLTGLGVRDRRIHFERFGPASVTRHAAEAEVGTAAAESILVNFAKSGGMARWRPDQGSLLDLAERSGVAPLSSCRSGICGTCSTRLIEGRVDYSQAPAHDSPDGEALICIATPHPGPHIPGSPDREGVTLDL